MKRRMSMVPAGKRKNGELSASTKSKALLKYILQMSNSEKTFPKRARWNTIDQMCKIAWRIFMIFLLPMEFLFNQKKTQKKELNCKKTLQSVL